MKEFGLIQRLGATQGSIAGVLEGIGDDAAVLARDQFDLVTVDTMVEGVHYLRRYSSPEAIGWKLLATNLSDIAAMGGRPGPGFLAMSLGPGADAAFVDGVLSGLRAAAEALVPEADSTGLAGGDTTSTSGPTVLSLTLLGRSAPAGPILRSGAREGDVVVLIGALGQAAAGLAWLASGREEARAGVSEALEAHRRPRAQVTVGALLGHEGLVSAMIDVSDGCLQDLGHILKASRVGARLVREQIPIAPWMPTLAKVLGCDHWDWVLAGGDDYALLAVAPPDKLGSLHRLGGAHHFSVAEIGEVGPHDEGLTVLDARGEVVVVERRGYEHSFADI